MVGEWGSVRSQVQGEVFMCKEAMYGDPRSGEKQGKCSGKHGDVWSDLCLKCVCWGGMSKRLPPLKLPP